MKQFTRVLILFGVLSLGGKLGLCASTADLTMPHIPAGCENDKNWEALRKAWDAFESKPTSAHLKALYQSLPPLHSGWSSTECKSEDQTREAIYRGVGLMEKKVKSGDSLALKTVLKMMNIADGDFEEELDVAAGAGLEKHPKAYLQAIKEDAMEGTCPGVDQLGEGFVDQPKAQKAELKKRIQALESVKDPALKTVKDHCLAGIQDNPVSR